MDFREKERKLSASEGIQHERVSGPGRKLPLEGYEAHPKDKPGYEVFGLKNSFDNLSVGADAEGRMTIAVTSQKDYHAPTLTSDQKKLKGTRRRIFYQHFGDFYTNSYSRGDGAFAFRTWKNLPESRILREMRRIASRHISERQREAMPILSLEDDRRRLTELRQQTGREPSLQKEKQAAENVTVRKTEMENRFIRRLRIARQQTYHGHSWEPDPLRRWFRAAEQDTEDEQTDENDDDGLTFIKQK